MTNGDADTLNLTSNKNDTLKFLNDNEFELLRRDLEFAFYKAGELFPDFDETKMITESQADKLEPFIFTDIHPFYRKQVKFRDALTKCFAHKLISANPMNVGSK